MSKKLIVTLDVDELKNIISESVTEAMAKTPAPPPVADVLHRRKEISEKLKVSLATLRTWEKAGQLPCHRIGTRVYYKWSEVLEALEMLPKRKSKFSKDIQT